MAKTRLGEQRPSLHFTAPRNWLNDPNGLVYHRGLYHLFYQHHPDSPYWGPMHWGWAVSGDCLRWEHRRPVLGPCEAFDAAFSGSAVAPADGGGIRLIFTGVRNGGGPDEREEAQYAAVLDPDGGKAELAMGGPLIPNPGLKDFRDPQVVRWEGRWLLSLACGDHVRFYLSDDLVDWKESGRFDPPGDRAGRVVECPNLIRFPASEGRDAWMLAYSEVEDGTKESRAWYLGGNVEAGAFASGWPESVPVDLGHDFYAPQAWSLPSSSAPRWTGWLNNWAYAQASDHGEWNGLLSLPRDLRWEATEEGSRLAQAPVAALSALPGEEVLPAGPSGRYAFPLPRSAVLIEGEVDADAASALRVLVRGGGEELVAFELDFGRRCFRVSRPPRPDLRPDGFDSRGSPLPAAARSKQGFRIVLDAWSAEAFFADGLAVASELLAGLPAAAEVSTATGRGLRCRCRTLGAAGLS